MLAVFVRPFSHLLLFMGVTNLSGDGGCTHLGMGGRYVGCGKEVMFVPTWTNVRVVASACLTKDGCAMS